MTGGLWRRGTVEIPFANGTLLKLFTVNKGLYGTVQTGLYTAEASKSCKRRKFWQICSQTTDSLTLGCLRWGWGHSCCLPDPAVQLLF